MKTNIIKRITEDKNLVLTSLITSSIIFFSSIFISGFTERNIYLGIGSLQYVIIIFMHLGAMLKRNNMNIAKINELSTEKGMKAFKEKRIIEGLAFSIATPMMIIGASMVLLMIAIMFI